MIINQPLRHNSTMAGAAPGLHDRTWVGIRPLSTPHTLTEPPADKPAKPP